MVWIAKVSASETGTESATANETDDELLLVNDALDRLAAHDPRKAELVKQKYFVGLTLEQAAEMLGIGLRTLQRKLKEYRETGKEKEEERS